MNRIGSNRTSVESEFVVPEVWEESVEVDVVVSRPAGEDPCGVDGGGEGGEGLEEGEELEQEAQAAAAGAAPPGAGTRHHPFLPSERRRRRELDLDSRPPGGEETFDSSLQVRMRRGRRRR